MASKSKRSPHVELCESEIPLPRPLNIIKRGQTITGSSASREIEWGGSGLSVCSDESRGSPPMTVNRPLTVHKRRAGRGTVLDGGFEQPLSAMSSGASAISDLIKKHANGTVIEDPDLTPKAAKQVPRSMSAGEFLKTEFHRQGTDSDFSIILSDLNPHGGPVSPPKIPDRRLSKSKAFFFRLGGRKDKEPKSGRGVDSSTSKNTLVRRFSLGSNRNAGSEIAYTESISSTESPGFLDAMSSGDIVDAVIDPRIPIYHRSSSHSESPVTTESRVCRAGHNFILCPEIKVTPEVRSLDGASTNLWVAVEVTGALRSTNSFDQNSEEFQEGRRVVSGENPVPCMKFGQLHSMRIELVTTRDSAVLEVVGNPNESEALHAGETHLMLAKIRIAKVTKASLHIRASSTSDEIMADLENHLGGAVTSFLTVRLSYKHSGFLHFEPTNIEMEGGLSSHTTKLQTEASAFIRRHNLHSAWSPRTSRETHGALEVNPLIPLIEMHFPKNKARDAIYKLADGRISIPMARRAINASEATGGSSEETVRVSTGSSISARISSAVSMSVLQPQSNIIPSEECGEQALGPPLSRAVQPTSEIDPARKIWTEMRRNSRGYRHPRGSVSADHYAATDLDGCSPSRLSSVDTVDDERRQIKDLALRNKRSVGADTLKSFAPSMGKAKGGTIGGLGLGVGRSWWVGGNWW